MRELTVYKHKISVSSDGTKSIRGEMSDIDIKYTHRIELGRFGRQYLFGIN
jgi:hypothetical protein